jgi:hypothetical protein
MYKNEEIAVNLSRAACSIEKHRYKALSTTIEDPVIEELSSVEIMSGAPSRNLQLTQNEEVLSGTSAGSRSNVIIDDDERTMGLSQTQALYDDLELNFDNDEKFSLDHIKRTLGASAHLLSNYTEVKKRKRELDELSELIKDNEVHFNSRSSKTEGVECPSDNSSFTPPPAADADGSSLSGAATAVDILHRTGVPDPVVIRIPLVLTNLHCESADILAHRLFIDYPWYEMPCGLQMTRIFNHTFVT